jgi:hypothetical protein
MLQQYCVLMSDPRLPTVFTRAQDIESLEGRVLAHVHDDLTGAPQIILEGTDCKVHFMRHTPTMEKLRAGGHLQPNHFVSFERIGSRFRIEDHGDAEAYLSSDHLRQTARGLTQRGITPSETEHKGWLGRYQKAVAIPQAFEPNRAALAGKEKDRSPRRALLGLGHKLTVLCLLAQLAGEAGQNVRIAPNPRVSQLFDEANPTKHIHRLLYKSRLEPTRDVVHT